MYSDVLENAGRRVLNEACYKYNLGGQRPGETLPALRQRLRDFPPEWRLDGDGWLESCRPSRPSLPPSSSLGPMAFFPSSQMPMRDMQFPGVPPVPFFWSQMSGLRAQQIASQGKTYLPTRLSIQSIKVPPFSATSSRW
jgi:hypothetical protein